MSAKKHKTLIPVLATELLRDAVTNTSQIAKRVLDPSTANPLTGFKRVAKKVSGSGLGDTPLLAPAEIRNHDRKGETHRLQTVQLLNSTY